MSPCTAKLSAFRSKQVGKYVNHPASLPIVPVEPKKTMLTSLSSPRGKPKSLFAQASAKKLGAEGASSGGALFGSKPIQQSNPFGN